MKPRAALGVLALAALGASCGPPLDEVWQLTNFRVLGVRMDNPTPAVGEDFVATLVTADPQPHPVSALWVLCPSTQFTGFASSPDGGAVSSDAGLGVPSSCQIGIGTRATFNTPNPGMVNGQNVAAIALFGVACNGTLNLAGSSFPTCTGDGAQEWQFLRTITLRAPTDTPNHNPHITGLLFGPSDGAVTALDSAAPPSVPPCTDTSSSPHCPGYQFQVTFSDDSRETYQGTDPDTAQPTQLTERMTVGFVIDGGTLGGGFRTDSSAFPMANMENDWRAPAETGTYHIIIYASDARGGFDFMARSIVVATP